MTALVAMEKTMSIGSIASFTPPTPGYNPAANNALTQAAAAADLEESQAAEAAQVQALAQNSSQLTGALPDISA